MVLYPRQSNVVVTTVYTPNFEIHAIVVFRGGYLWVPKSDALRCAQLIVGYQQDDVQAWTRRTSDTPATLTHAVLFDIPSNALETPPHLREELTTPWARITDRFGNPFGVAATLFVRTIEMASSSFENASVGLAIAERWHEQKRPAGAYDAQCRYLSGLEHKEKEDGDDVSLEQAICNI
jgi:hypothetical protein